MAKAKAKSKTKAKLKAVPSKAAKKTNKKVSARSASAKAKPKAPVKKSAAQKTSAPKGATVHSLADARAKSPSTAPQRKKQNANRDWSTIISPLDDRVLVQLINEERMTPGGLYIPDTATVSGNLQASVVAIGRGHRDKKGRIRPLELKVGDRVLIGEYAGSIVEIDGEKLQIVRESEVLGTLA